MDSWINVALLSHPMNWIIVALVLIFVAYGGFAIWNNLSSLTPNISVQQKGN